MKRLIRLSALALAAGACAAYGAPTQYGGTWCGHAKVTPIVVGPALSAYTSEVWAIETAGSVPKALEGDAVHCVGYTRIEKGKHTGRSACRFTDPQGDWFVGEATRAPGEPNVWTFLAGSGKWKGIQGSGTFKIVSQTKPRAGSLELCLRHSGTFTVPEKK